MPQNMDSMTERFETSFFVLMQNLGPQLICHAPLGLTPGQVFMLHVIRKDSTCSVSKLAEKLEVAPSAITVMLDRLEQHGFVSRTRDKADRRVVLIGLTDKGEETLNLVLAARKRVIQHCLTQVEAGEMESFIHTLEKLATIAQSMDIQAIIGLPNEGEKQGGSI